MEALSPKIRLIISLLLFSVGGYIGYTMWHSELWGWWPMFLQLSIWVGFLLLIFQRYSKHPLNSKFVIAATLSGLLLSISFPPSFGTPLIFISLVPLLWIEHNISISGKIQKWNIWKYAFHSFYLWNVIATFWVVNTAFVAGLIANILNAIIMATVFMLFHWAKSYIHRKWYFVALASIWISFEYIHMFWDINWPWLTLGNTFSRMVDMVQWYEFTGVFGGSLWVLGINYMFFKAYLSFQKTEKKFSFKLLPIIQIAFFILIPIGISYLIKLTDKGTYLPEIEVGIIQPNFEPHYQKFEVSDEETLNRFLSLSDSILTDQTDYLIFPETSFGYVFLNNIDNDRYIQPLKDYLFDKPNVKILTGIASYRSFNPGDELPLNVRTQGDRYYDVQNSAILIDGKKREIEVYFKSKLVPGAEFFPFKKVLPFIKPIIDQLGGSQGHTKQKERTVFNNLKANFAPVICYESIYGEFVGEYVKMGANIIAIVTNDGWWDNTPGHKQHLLFARLRAIEHRRPIARSANTGTSAFITPMGKILQPTQYEKTTAIRSSIKPRTDITFYTKYGDLIARICLIIAILFIVYSLSRSFMRKSIGRRG